MKLLLDRIMLRLDYERQLLSLKRHAFFVVPIFILALALTIPATMAFWSDFTRSGFGMFLSLLFSDGRTVLDNWQDYTLSLLESLPALSTAGFLTILFALIAAAKFFRNYLRALKQTRYGRI